MYTRMQCLKKNFYNFGRRANESMMRYENSNIVVINVTVHTNVEPRQCTLLIRGERTFARE